MKKTLLVFVLILVSIHVMGCEKYGKEVTISYDSALEGAPSIQSMKVERGSIIEEPEYVETFTHDDQEYEFIGWYDENGKFNFDQHIEEDKKLNASWRIFEKANASLMDLSPKWFFGYSSPKSVTIITIDSLVASFTTDDIFFNVYTRYRITTTYDIFGTYSVDYIDIIGGEVAPHIYKWYDFHFLEFLEPNPGEYYLMLHSSPHDMPAKKIIGHSLIKLSTYDPTKDLLEQDEETMSIILPYIVEAEKHS